MGHPVSHGLSVISKRLVVGLLASFLAGEQLSLLALYCMLTTCIGIAIFSKYKSQHKCQSEGDGDASLKNNLWHYLFGFLLTWAAIFCVGFILMYLGMSPAHPLSPAMQRNP